LAFKNARSFPKGITPDHKQDACIGEMSVAEERLWRPAVIVDACDGAMIWRGRGINKAATGTYARTTPTIRITMRQQRLAT